MLVMFRAKGVAWGSFLFIGNGVLGRTGGGWSDVWLEFF